LTVSTRQTGELCVLQIATEAVGKENNDHASSHVDPEDSLGLSACQGILQEHQGQILRERRDDGSLILSVQLPAGKSLPATKKESTVPVLWQSRPYA
jgi:hypothetical protein